MSLRPAKLDDLPEIIALGELLHDESPRWRRLRYSRVRVAETIAALITNPNGLVLVAERDGHLIGGVAAVCSPHWSSDDLTAEEISLFVHPDHRGSLVATRLICALRKWGELRGAVWTSAGTSTGLDPEMTAGLYERLGWTRCAIGLEVLNHGD